MLVPKGELLDLVETIHTIDAKGTKVLMTSIQETCECMTNFTNMKGKFIGLSNL